MNKSVFATAYMPPIAFFVALNSEKDLNLCSSEYYKKQTFRNRAVIITSQGLQTLTVPVSCSNGPMTSIKDVKVCYNKDWQKDHWRSLCTAYNNSPYFLYYKDGLEDIFHKHFETLWDLNIELINFFVTSFKWTKSIVEVYDIESPKIEFSEKDDLVWKAFSTNGFKTGYQNTFLQEVKSVEKLSCCDLLFNYGPEIKGYL